LFTSIDSMRRCWGHWSYAEFLAARYLVPRALSVRQMTDLLFYPDDLGAGRRQVVPPLAETAAWLASGAAGRFLHFQDKIVAGAKVPLLNHDLIPDLFELPCNPHSHLLVYHPYRAACCNGPSLGL
jgi:hypothetical protein